MMSNVKDSSALVRKECSQKPIARPEEQRPLVIKHSRRSPKKSPMTSSSSAPLIPQAALLTTAKDSSSNATTAERPALQQSSSEPLFDNAINQQISSDLILSIKLNESLNNIQPDTDKLSHVPYATDRTVASLPPSSSSSDNDPSQDPECTSDCCTSGFIKVRRSRAQRWKPNCETNSFKDALRRQNSGTP